MEKLHIAYPVIVEGKYDRLRLLSVMEGQILTTDGFGIFKNKEKAALLRALAAKTPLIVLTDPDGAGTLIRAHIGAAVPKERITDLDITSAITTKLESTIFHHKNSCSFVRNKHLNINGTGRCFIC